MGADSPAVLLEPLLSSLGFDQEPWERMPAGHLVRLEPDAASRVDRNGGVCGGTGRGVSMAIRTYMIPSFERAAPARRGTAAARPKPRAAPPSRRPRRVHEGAGARPSSASSPSSCSTSLSRCHRPSLAPTRTPAWPALLKPSRRRHPPAWPALLKPSRRRHPPAPASTRRPPALSPRPSRPRAAVQLAVGRFVSGARPMSTVRRPSLSLCGSLGPSS